MQVQYYGDGHNEHLC